MTEDHEQPAHWTFDKRIPIAFLFAIAVQSACIVYWAAQISERVYSLERRADTTAPQGDRLTRVEVKIENIQEGINRIERRLFASPNP